MHLPIVIKAIESIHFQYEDITHLVLHPTIASKIRMQKNWFSFLLSGPAERPGYFEEAGTFIFILNSQMQTSVTTRRNLLLGAAQIPSTCFLWSRDRWCILKIKSRENAQRRWIPLRTFYGVLAPKIQRYKHTHFLLIV